MVEKDLLRQPSIDQKRDDSVNNLKRFYKEKILIQFWHGLTLTVPAKVKSVKYFLFILTLRELTLAQCYKTSYFFNLLMFSKLGLSSLV
jgi:hypothetical protein